jgi:hypothetical protein
MNALSIHDIKLQFHVCYTTYGAASHKCSNVTENFSCGMLVTLEKGRLRLGRYVPDSTANGRNKQNLLRA